MPEKEKIAGNPVKIDHELKGLLERLEFVKTYRTFRRWRNSFLARFETFFEEEGIIAADKAYRCFSQSMEKFVEDVQKVEKYVDKGELTVERYTVRARHCLSEMSKNLTKIILEEDELIPQTGSIEKKRGYNKFHMGAVLIRDGFEEYGRLRLCGDILKHMREVSLGEVVDKQILGKFDQFNTTLEKFCDVMSDLGLYEIMLKCREFAHASFEEELIFLDLKTGGIGELGRADCIQKHLITALSKDDKGHDVFQETIADVDERERILELIKKSKKLGLNAGNSENQFSSEDKVDLDSEKIKNMWGVTLKKTEKNEKGSEFIFVDQMNGAFGELSRKLFVERGLITEVKDENGRDVLGEAEDDFEERASLVEVLRAVLALGVVKE